VRKPRPWSASRPPPRSTTTATPTRNRRPRQAHPRRRTDRA
jgi:hypothetical protein